MSEFKRISLVKNNTTRKLSTIIYHVALHFMYDKFVCKMLIILNALCRCHCSPQ